MEKSQLRKRRDAAVSIELDIEKGDWIVDLIHRENGLFAITLKTIIRTRSPDHLDPDLDHPDAPWEQSVYLPLGSSDPLVARTILQTKALADIFFVGKPDEHRALMDISWEVLNSLVSLRVIRERLEARVSDIMSIVDKDFDTYTKGQSPKPLPIVEYYDVEFRSFVNEVRRALSTISNLFAVLTPKDFGGAHFHKALDWARGEYGESSLLATLLKNDQEWIKAWIDMRIAIEHPKKDKFIETLNFALEADRTIRLPTWRFVHPDYDMGQPQNLLEVFGFCIDNILKFYEELQIALADGHLPPTVKVGIDFVEEEERDPNCPMRLNFGLFGSGLANDH